MGVSMGRMVRMCSSGSALTVKVVCQASPSEEGAEEGAWLGTITGLVLNLLGAGLLAFVPLVVRGRTGPITNLFGQPVVVPPSVEGEAKAKRTTWRWRCGWFLMVLGYALQIVGVCRT